MGIKMNKLDLNNIITKIDNNLNYVLEFNQKFKINKIFNFKNISNDDMEYLLNYYISNILNIYTKQKYLKFINLINDIYKQCIIKANNIIYDEASILADDILQKVLNIKTEELK